MKKQGIKNYIEVSPIANGEKVEIEDDEHDMDDESVVDIEV